MGSRRRRTRKPWWLYGRIMIHQTPTMMTVMRSRPKQIYVLWQTIKQVMMMG
ncbi:hypothetical protein REPUB_Repub07fG0088600 [Reevesia pubescens]